MARVFLSYSTKDSEVVERLSVALGAHSVEVWRDQERLKAGDRWPKVLGEEIAASDAIVLLWSRDAKASDWVEMEWTTALALGRPVFPVGLDDTEAPEILAAVQRTFGPDLENAAGEISLAIGGAATPNNPRPAAANRLESAPPEVDAVLAQMRPLALQAVRDNFGVVVEGGIHSGGGDIHIHSSGEAQSSSDSGLQKIALWMTVIAGVVAVLSLALDLPAKLGLVGRLTPPIEKGESVVQLTPPIEKGESVVQPLAGTLQDESGNPIAGARVSVAAYGLETVTDDLGWFDLSVPGDATTYVNLTATADGYQTLRANGVLVGTRDLSYSMQRIGEQR